MAKGSAGAGSAGKGRQASSPKAREDTAATNAALAARARSNETFSKDVLAAARTVGPEGRFGDDRVFIHVAYAAYKKTEAGKASGLNLEQFKDRLLSANTSRHLSLSRLDLAEAFSRRTVSASTTKSEFGTFNFIRLE